MKHPLGQTKNGVEVHVDLIKSKAAKHIAEQPYLTELLKTVLAAIEPTEQNLTIEHNMKRPIGYDFVIETSEKDAVFYAKLVKETNFTKFIKNGNPSATEYLTITLRRDDDSYELTNIWIGRSTPALPGSDHETSDSASFWATHALVFANQPLQSQTLTRTCPYEDVTQTTAVI